VGNFAFVEDNQIRDQVVIYFSRLMQSSSVFPLEDLFDIMAAQSLMIKILFSQQFLLLSRFMMLSSILREIVRLVWMVFLGLSSQAVGMLWGMMLSQQSPISSP